MAHSKRFISPRPATIPSLRALALVTLSLAALATVGCGMTAERCHRICSAKGMVMAGISTGAVHQGLNTATVESCHCEARNVAASSARPTTSVGSGCSKDTDCKGDRICEKRRCVSPDGPPVAVAPAVTPAAPTQTPATPAEPTPPPEAKPVTAIPMGSMELMDAALKTVADWTGRQVVVKLHSGEEVAGLLWGVRSTTMVIVVGDDERRTIDVLDAVEARLASAP